MARARYQEEQMADNYDRYGESSNGGGFMMGLLTGTVLGAGLGMLLAPKAGAELRGQVAEQAKNLGNYAADQYKKAGDTATEWAGKGREMVDRAREAVSRGAEEARSYTGSTPSGSSSFGTGTTGSGGSDFGRS